LTKVVARWKVIKTENEAYKIYSFHNYIGINSCSVYNFTGTGKIDADTFQVGFQNNAELIEPGIDRTFTLELKI
jgi:hypothetical protein